MKNETSAILKDAESGDPISQDILGARYATGNGVEKNAIRALYWYLQAAMRGYVNSYWNAGSMIIEGDEGLEPNTRIGMKLIRVAAEAGNSSACLFLSNCYKNGLELLEKNLKLADDWEKRAWNIEESKIYVDAFNFLKEYGITIEMTKGRSTIINIRY